MQKEIDRRGRDRAGENAPGFVGRAGRDGRAPGDRRERGHERGEDEGVDEPDLRNDEFGQVIRREFAWARAAELLGEGRPAVRGVPDDERGEYRERDGEARKQSRRDKPAAQRGRREQGEDDAGREKGGGELRLQREAKRQAQRDQPAPLARAPELDQGAKPKRPKHDQRSIGGDEHRADRDERHGDPHQRRERGFFRRMEQAPGDEGDKGGHRANDEERKRPHAELGAAEQRSRGADDEGDHRRVVEIPERQGARPKRIIGFVEGELEPPGGQRLHGQKRNRRCAGVKTKPCGAAQARFSPRGGDHGIAAHVVAFASSPPLSPSRASVARPRARRQSLAPKMGN